MDRSEARGYRTRSARFGITCRTCGKILAHQQTRARARHLIDEHACPEPEGEQTTIIGAGPEP